MGKIQTLFAVSSMEYTWGHGQLPRAQEDVETDYAISLVYPYEIGCNIIIIQSNWYLTSR